MRRVDNYNKKLILRRNLNLLYFKELFNTSVFVIYFNCSRIERKHLYSFKHELLKKGLKSCIINAKYIKELFEENFKFLNSNIFFIYCNGSLDLLYVFKRLNNIKFFLFFNKNLNSTYFKEKALNKNLVFFHFILFKLTFNLLIVILFYIINFLKSIKQ